MDDARAAGGRTFKPPAFFERDSDHTFVQPPSFQMSRQDKVDAWRRNEQTDDKWGTNQPGNSQSRYQQQAVTTNYSNTMRTSSSSDSLFSNSSRESNVSSVLAGHWA